MIITNGYFVTLQLNVLYVFANCHRSVALVCHLAIKPFLEWPPTNQLCNQSSIDFVKQMPMIDYDSQTDSLLNVTRNEFFIV